ncbi:MAG: hypothetical protein LBJ32_03030 [Oscillospiraceae bacterium]|jgi:hypothetical protein|nr:hypothetical protein [Oscillospiraceae bacterium]
MTITEKWTAFFRWFTDKTKTSELNELIETEERLKLATNALRYVSKDETTRRMIIQRDIAKRDLDHKMF